MIETGNVLNVDPLYNTIVILDMQRIEICRGKGKNGALFQHESIHSKILYTMYFGTAYVLLADNLFATTDASVNNVDK